MKGLLLSFSLSLSQFNESLDEHATDLTLTQTDRQTEGGKKERERRPRKATNAIDGNRNRIGENTLLIEM